MLSTEKIWDFWDIVSPISLVVYAFIVLFSLYSWRKWSSLFLFVGAILNTLIAFLFSWSIGKYLIIVPILQLIAAIYILVTRYRRKRIR